jgi:hypothetical protein
MRQSTSIARVGSQDASGRLPAHTTTAKMNIPQDLGLRLWPPWKRRRRNKMREYRVIIRAIVEDLEKNLGINAAFPITRHLADAHSEIIKRERESEVRAIPETRPR